ncbi:MAG: LLM class flavin-dependent oxidoreductase [Xanthobacteraceae bacterium]|nr:LLM class flavin-dependent oxidoreductase [Xanthobacteraceae bacterium]MBX3533441.1 LLM class flavin-dependent oxidoreductase [Xanthobacteraceae bacterium]MCW5676381.1 LLM class flavin-dependent oxidoreductase [Xanthobacteraceae bacterium]
MPVQVGIVLPTFYGGAYEDNNPSMARLTEFGQRVEDMGFHGLWVIDHLVVAPPIYRTAWLEPLTVLSSMIAVTKRVTVGTSILVTPIRTPAILAKTLNTMDYLSNGRVILGSGVGWWEQEFEVCGIPKKERGERTEETVDILHKLGSGASINHEGKYWQFKDVTMTPRPVQKRIPVWYAGGSAAGHANDVYTPQVERVMRRIARQGDGWLSRAVTNPELMKKDWAMIQQYSKEYGRDPKEITFAHLNLVCLTPDNDTNKEEGYKRMAKISNMPKEDVLADYMVGTKAEILKRLDNLVELGVRYFVLWPTGFDYELLTWLKETVLHRYEKVQ